MKVALLAILGLLVGALGGAALGVGLGLAWVVIFRTAHFGGHVADHGGMLMFSTFMPLGAAIGGIGGALLFGFLAVQDSALAIVRGPARRQGR